MGKHGDGVDGILDVRGLGSLALLRDPNCHLGDLPGPLSTSVLIF